MNFTSIVKGQIAQALVTTLLERSGYRVIRFGIEELFSEVKHLDLSQYQALNLPMNLRALPDLLVADSTIENAFLVEVKFRRNFDKSAMQSLYKALRNQREHWPSYAVIMIANSFVKGGRYHQDYIRVVGPEKTELLNPDGDDPRGIKSLQGIDRDKVYKNLWNSLPMLNHAFDKLDAVALDNADIMTPALRVLAKL